MRAIRRAIVGLGVLLAAVLRTGTAHSAGVDYVDCGFDAAAGTLEVTEKFSVGFD